jgi:hypothetical protein
MFPKHDVLLEFSKHLFPSGQSQWPRGLSHELSNAPSNTGIVPSNPTRSMDVYARLFCVCIVLCVGCGLATG